MDLVMQEESLADRDTRVSTSKNDRPGARFGVYLTESVYKVVLQKSFPAKTRQLIPYYY